jgi:hypothetical protein
MLASMRKRRRGKVQHVSKVLDAAYPGREPADLAAVRAFAWWDKVVPARVARNARPVRLVRGTLIVHARTAAWSQELSFLQADLLNAIQERAPTAGVQRLRMQVGPLPPPPTRMVKPKPKVQPIEVGELPGELARAIAHVKDDALRDVVSLAARTSLADGKKRKPRSN